MRASSVDYGSSGSWSRIEWLLTEHPPQPASNGGLHHCEPGWTWQPKMADFDLWLVFEGRGQALINGDLPVDIHPGTLLVLRPGDTGDFTQDDDHRLSVMSCHFDFHPLDAAEPSPVTDELLPRRVINIQSLGLLTGLMRQLLRAVRDPSPLRQLDAQARLLEVFTEIYRQDALDQGVRLGGFSPQLQDAIELIRSRPAERHTLSATAAAVGVSSRQLSGLFSGQLGVTFRDYLLESRLERGQALLRETSMSINQIARALGYADQFLFSRQFRARYGEPPSHFRGSIHRSGRS